MKNAEGNFKYDLDNQLLKRRKFPRNPSIDSFLNRFDIRENSLLEFDDVIKAARVALKTHKSEVYLRENLLKIGAKIKSGRF